MPLSDKTCQKIVKDAQEQNKTIKKADGHGLYLCAQPNGSAYWRYKYRFMGKEKLLSLGIYPETTLAEAREKHRIAHKQVYNKIDPSKARQDEARNAQIDAANTYEVIAREWHQHNLEKWSRNHADTVMRRLELYMFPAIGKLPIRDITAPILLTALRGIEKRKAFEVARRSLQMSSQIFRYAIVTGRADRDIAVDLRGALKPFQRTNYAAMEIKDLPDFIRRLDRNEARLFPQTRLAVELMMLTFVRTSELIKAKWSEIDLDEAVWIIPAARMKMRKEHIVPLSTQSIAILCQLKEINPNRDYIFPSQKNPRSHMSNNTILMALGRMGYRGIHTGHGFRALAMSTIKERLHYRHEVVDRQLAHAPGNQVDKAYDRAKFLDQRKVMMQDWANYLDSLKKTDIDNFIEAH